MFDDKIMILFNWKLIIIEDSNKSWVSVVINYIAVKCVVGECIGDQGT